MVTKSVGQITKWNQTKPYSIFTCTSKFRIKASLSKIQDCPKRKDLDQSNLSNPQQIAVVEEATDEGDKDLNIGESQRTVSQEAEYVERRRGQTNQDHSDRLKRQTSSYKDQDFVY